MTTKTTTQELIRQTHQWEELANTPEMKIFVLQIRARLEVLGELRLNLKAARDVLFSHGYGTDWLDAALERTNV